MEILAFASFFALVVAWMVAPSSPTVVKIATKLQTEAA